MAVVMLINDYEVSEKELQKEWQMVKAQYAQESLVNDKFDEITLSYAKQSIITRVLIEKLVEELDEEIDFKEIKEEYVKMVEHFGGKEAFFEHFKQEKLSEFEIKLNIEKSLRVDRLMNRWKKEALSLMNEAEVIAHFEQNSKNYEVRAGIIAMHFLLPIPKSKEAKERYDADLALFESSFELFLENKNETVFMKTLEEVKFLNTIKSVKIEKGYLPKEFEEKVFNIKNGDYSGLIKGVEGIHLFKKEDTYTANALEFDEVQDQVREHLASIKKDKYIKEKMIQLRSEANIKDFF